MNTKLALKQLIAAEKKAHTAKVKVQKAIALNKKQILNEFKNETFDFLELLQLDKTMRFTDGKKYTLFYNFNQTGKEAIDYSRKSAINGENNFLLLTVNCYIRFSIGDDFIPVVILEKCKLYSTNEQQHYTTVADFVKAFTPICLQRRLTDEG